MEFDNINTLLCAIVDYRNMLNSLLGNKDQSTVDKLHDVIANINPDEISGISSKFDVWKPIIPITFENLLSVTKELHSMIMRGLSDYKERIDPDIQNVFTFLSKLLEILPEEYNNLKKRRKTEPTENDLSIIKNFQCFRDGAYNDMSFYDFVNIVIINDESNDVAIRRLNYLKRQCTDEERTVLDKMLNELEHPKSSESSAAKAAKPTEPESVQQQQSQSGEALKTYSPIKSFDIKSVFDFLKESGVIVGCEEQQFRVYITTANLQQIHLGKRKKTYLYCLITHLKRCYEDTWYSDVVKNMGMNGKNGNQLLRVNYESKPMRDFDDELRKIMEPHKRK